MCGELKIPLFAANEVELSIKDVLDDLELDWSSTFRTFKVLSAAVVAAEEHAVSKGTALQSTSTGALKTRTSSSPCAADRVREIKINPLIFGIDSKQLRVHRVAIAPNLRPSSSARDVISPLQKSSARALFRMVSLSNPPGTSLVYF